VCVCVCVYVLLALLCVCVCAGGTADILGHGVLTESNGSLYDGSFHNHKRHGKGMQIYQ